MFLSHFYSICLSVKYQNSSRRRGGQVGAADRARWTGCGGTEYGGALSISESSGLAGQLVNKFKPAARGTPACLSRRRGPWSSHIFKLPAPECTRAIRPAVVESLRPMRTGLSSSKKQEIKNLRRRAIGLKDGHVHPRLSGEKILFFFYVTAGIRTRYHSFFRCRLNRFSIAA